MEVKDLKGLMIAHRGLYNEKIIENTIPAFSMALDKNIPIELDLRLLKDGNIVVYHDHNLKRLMNINKDIYGYTYDEIKQLTFPNTNTHIPLFKDVLDLVNKKVLIVVEIKEMRNVSYKEYCKKIESILNKYDGNFVIKSFDIRIVNWFLKNTDYITGLLIGKPNKKKKLYCWIINKKMILKLLNPDFLSVDYHLLSDKKIQKFKQKNPVLTWTIRNQKTLNEVKDKADGYLVEGFDFIR